jgi:hypothetical protein
MTYTGSMYGRRNPQSLFEAVKLLIDKGEVERDKILFRFVGRFGSDIEEIFAKSGLMDTLEIIPYLPHSDSIKKLIESDALLLVVDEAKESQEIVPGKVFEYMGVKKAILAISPENSAIAGLLSETNCGRAAHQSNIQGIAEIYLDYYNKWKNGEPIIEANEAMINKYERRESAKKLAELLDELCK